MTSTVRATARRLVIPAPDAGWLTIFGEPCPYRAKDLVDGWSVMTTASVAAARLPEYRRANVVVTFHPEKIAAIGQYGVHVAEDLRPTWHVVRRVLRDASVMTDWETLRLGPVAAPGLASLELELVEVAR